MTHDETADTTAAMSAPAAGAETRQAGPRGIGTAVAFDWAIGAELLMVGPLVAVGALGSAQFAAVGTPARLAAGVATVLAAAPLLALGEALRRGVRQARVLQVIFQSALIVYGIVQIPQTLGELQHGHVSGLARTAYLLIVSPLAVWGLTRPQTRAWFATTTSAAARQRHGGVRWLLPIALFAVIGGASIAFAGSY
jgi:hypothetical protein